MLLAPIGALLCTARSLKVATRTDIGAVRCVDASPWSEARQCATLTWLASEESMRAKLLTTTARLLPVVRVGPFLQVSYHGVSEPLPTFTVWDTHLALGELLTLILKGVWRNLRFTIYRKP